ncbi:MAG: hypothetical protein N3C60_09470 [Calditerrivibrio sp.]|nr:hypothetical protein [Calditerrivibrio sp.]
MNTMFSIGIGLHLLDKLSSPLKTVTQATDNLSKSLMSAKTTFLELFHTYKDHL